MNNYSNKAKFENVKFDADAVEFHAMKYGLGMRYPLALACYQLTQLMKIKEENNANKK